MLDAVGCGMAASLVVTTESADLICSADERRQRLARALVPLLSEWMEKGKRLDGVFALKAAELQVKVNPPRPADYVHGAMVIAQDPALTPFKSEVVRWTVWKFSPAKKYNYVRKLDMVPGRSVLMILTPRDLRELPARFPGQPRIKHALDQAYKALKQKKAVIVPLTRESRGHIFVMAAHDPPAMKRLAKAFFDLKTVPTEVIGVD
jgi:hypothetical protein